MLTKNRLPEASKIPARPLGLEIVQRPDPHASVRQKVVVGTVGEAVPQVVVPQQLAAVLVDDPVPTSRLVREVVHHGELGIPDHQELELGGRGVVGGLCEGPVRQADRLAVVKVGALVAGVVPAPTNVAVGERREIEV